MPTHINTCGSLAYPPSKSVRPICYVQVRQACSRLSLWPSDGCVASSRLATYCSEPKDVSSFADTVCSVLPDRREDRTTASDSDESPALQGTSNDPSVRMYTDCREKRMGKSLTLRFNAFQKFVLLQEVDPSKEVCKAGE
ncbi:unnamed protein product [Ixodes persulcatus]